MMKRAKLLGLLVAILPGTARGLDEIVIPDVSPEQIQEAVNLIWDLGDAYQRGDLPELTFTREEFQNLNLALEKALNAQEVNELADLQSLLLPAIQAFSQTESGQAYVSWLLQRYDYAVVASWSRREVQKKIERLDRKPPPEKIVSIQDQYVSDLRVWKHRLSDRAIPKGAKELVPMLKDIFRAKGVPESLVWLAEVESTFNPEAISPVGAKGLFQFMPRTAEWMGLSLTPEDERVDPQKSAAAAADYLTYLHKRFGDWPLVLAAYNAGEGRVRRLMEKLNVDSFNGIAASLPSETRMYVPKVMATIELREGEGSMPVGTSPPR